MSDVNWRWLVSSSLIDIDIPLGGWHIWGIRHYFAW